MFYVGTTEVYITGMINFLSNTFLDSRNPLGHRQNTTIMPNLEQKRSHLELEGATYKKKDPSGAKKIHLEQKRAIWSQKEPSRAKKSHLEFLNIFEP